ncbi:hypothetical protein Ade02nite_90830 [Paractinoplanes deccanensis]|uniref:Segregation and condensation protein A n=1 Tax=Paractinoplanes deccanensis TaxID=113561 RepID=A0ABQ3YKA9_9ACTN|nr:hypothetical protein Ade02nite_90830 [Actinoplanes deccanensis]
MVYGQQVPEEPVSPLSPEEVAAADDSGKFLVRLDNFTGPFDLLLQLIGKHKLDVTEVALHQVTDDFIAYIRAMGDDWDLGEASEFLLVAATLLDLKAARLLPAADVEDEEDLALLEARDLLFARLLQYKAFKEAAAHIAELELTGGKRWPRAVSMEPRYAEALPDLVLGIGPERLFKLALKQFVPKPGPPQVSIAHIHQVRVSVREHAALLRDRLRRAGSATFTLLVADCDNTLEVVARFLALLELYREGLIDFDQPVSLDELTVRWIGGDAPDIELDIDDYEGTKPAEGEEAPPKAGQASSDPESADVVDGAELPDGAFPADAEFSDISEPSSGSVGGSEPSGSGESDISESMIEPRSSAPHDFGSAESVSLLGSFGGPDPASPSVAPGGVPSPDSASPSVAAGGVRSPDSALPSVAAGGVRSPDSALPSVAPGGAPNPDSASPSVALDGAPNPGSDISDMSVKGAPPLESDDAWRGSGPMMNGGVGGAGRDERGVGRDESGVVGAGRGESGVGGGGPDVAQSADSAGAESGKGEAGRLDVGGPGDDLGGVDDEAEGRS